MKQRREKPLSETNPYFRDPKLRDKMILVSAASSAAIEGKHADVQMQVVRRKGLLNYLCKKSHNADPKEDINESILGQPLQNVKYRGGGLVLHGERCSLASWLVRTHLSPNRVPAHPSTVPQALRQQRHDFHHDEPNNLQHDAPHVRRDVPNTNRASWVQQVFLTQLRQQGLTGGKQESLPTTSRSEQIPQR